MADSNYLKNIVLVGASGNVGSPTLKHLLASDRAFTITVLSRADSSSTFPTHPSLTVQKGSYDDPAFLESVFQNQDAVLLALGFRGMAEQAKLITAAAKAGVKYILPTEYAGDGLNKEMMEGVPVFHPKVQARKQIEEAGSTWIGIATNPWADQSLRLGLTGIKLFEKKAVMYKDSGKFNMSTLEQVGLGIARLLALPIRNAEKKRASLGYYENNFVYLSSFSVTQKRVWEAALKATGTGEGEWTVEEDTVEDWIRRSREMLGRGEMMGAMGLTFAYYLGEGLGGDYQSKAVEDLEVLGMKEEDFDAVVKAEVDKGPKPQMHG